MVGFDSQALEVRVLQHKVEPNLKSVWLRKPNDESLYILLIDIFQVVSLF